MQYVLRVRRTITGAKDDQGNPIASPLVQEDVVPLDSLCGVRVTVDETIDDNGQSTVGVVTLQFQVGGAGLIPANARLQSLLSRFIAVGALTRFDDATIIARLYARRDELVELLKNPPSGTDVVLEFIDFDSISRLREPFRFDG